MSLRTMTLKIATGTKKGITIASSKSAKELRPTQSLVREALINTLNCWSQSEYKIAGSDILDLFAGVGTVGFEFLSNSANTVTFLEANPICVKIIRSNMKRLEFQDKVYVLKTKIPPALKQLVKKNPVKSFDLVYGDPPYGQVLRDSFSTSRLFDEIIQLNILKRRGLLVWEVSDPSLENRLSKGVLEHLALIKKKKYGDSFLYFFFYS